MVLNILKFKTQISILSIITPVVIISLYGEIWFNCVTSKFIDVSFVNFGLNNSKI